MHEFTDRDIWRPRRPKSIRISRSVHFGANPPRLDVKLPDRDMRRWARELTRMDFPNGEITPGRDGLRLSPQSPSCTENRRRLSAQRPPSGGRLFVRRGRELVQGVDAASACPPTIRQVWRRRWGRAARQRRDRPAAWDLAAHGSQSPGKGQDGVQHPQRAVAAFEAWRRGWLA